jgi:predicted metal-dependent phosphoesterase TrpH
LSSAANPGANSGAQAAAAPRATAAGDGVDFHLHSTCSDGVLAPRDVIALAANAGVRQCALTDHDTVAGVAEAGAAAATAGIGFVAGVELSALWQGRTIHVVGLGFDPEAPALAAAIAARAAARRSRAERIRDRLDRAGAPGTAAYALVAEHPLPTRTHFARALVSLGAAADPGQAFQRWLGRGKPAQVPSEWPDVGEAVTAIAAAGGVAVLAHPLRYVLSNGQRRELCRAFRAAGGHGLEVVTGGQAPHQLELATGLALRSDLAGSAGSDCHDPALPWHRPGRLAKLPAAVVPVWQRWHDLPGAAARPGAPDSPSFRPAEA